MKVVGVQPSANSIQQQTTANGIQLPITDSVLRAEDLYPISDSGISENLRGLRTPIKLM